MDARILLVEDDPSIREVTAIGLRSAGFTVETADDGDSCGAQDPSAGDDDRERGQSVSNAGTRDQPIRSNSEGVSAGVMKSAPYFALKPPSDSTCTGPARFTSPCCMTICTPGCAGSVVLNTAMHSCALSMR